MTKATRSALATAAIALVSIAVQTSAAVVVGIDDAGDRIVALDLASADVLPLIEGRGLRASSVRWSPDGSFAYLSAADGVLVYDSEREEVIGRIEIEEPGPASFCEDHPIALIEDQGDLNIVDTRQHRVVGRNHRRGQVWACSSSARWAASADGVVIDLQDPTRESWLPDCYGYDRPLAAADDRRLEQPGGSDSKGNELPVDVRAGLLRVRGTVRPSATATLAATVTATPTVEERTESRREVALANQPASGSCQVTAPADNAPAALALVGLALVALMSRRRTSD